jgi:hypothetical protein
VCTSRVAHERFAVLQVSHDWDGDWQFLDATSDELGEPVLLCMGCVFERDPSLREIADLPLGWSAFRPAVGDPWERWEKEPEDAEDDDHVCLSKEEGEKKALEDIEKYGLHVISVTGDEENPPFTYSLGIERSLGQPELIVIGLRSGVAHAAINELYRQMKDGLQLKPGIFVEDLLGGDFSCRLDEVLPEQFKDFMFWTTWLHEGTNYRVFQIVYPSTANVYPWEPDAPDAFKQWQPMLGKT